MWFKKSFLALLRKYLKLFISMCLVGVFGVTFFISGLSSYINLKNEFYSYLDEYHYPDLIISTLVAKDSDFNGIRDLDGIERINTRFSYPVEMQHDENILTGIVSSYNDSLKESLFVSKEVECDGYSVYVSDSFANNNNIKPGDTVTFSLYGESIEVYVGGIVYSPETMFTTVNGVPVDDIGYGYVYVSETDLVSALTEHELVDLTTYRNQVLINIEEGYEAHEMVEECLEVLPGGVSVISTFAGDDLIVRDGVNANVHAIGLNSMIIPSSFLGISVGIVILFVMLIIQKETRLFGILMSLGVKKRRLFLLFEALVLFITVCALALGIFAAVFASKGFSMVYKASFFLPILASSLSVKIIFICVGSVLLANTLACLFACLPISKLTPVEIIYDKVRLNKKKERKIKTKDSRFQIGNIPKLACNSIKEHKAKFIVSIASLFASFILLFVSVSLWNTTKYSVDEYAVNRCNFSCQVYVLDGNADYLINKIKTCDGVGNVETIRISYTSVSFNGRQRDITLTGIDPEHEFMRLSKKANKSYVDIPEDGIVLEKRTAQELGVKIHDYVTIGDKELEVTDLSELCFNKLQAVSLKTFDALGLDGVDSLLFNAANYEQVEKVISDSNTLAYTELTENMASYIRASVSGYKFMIAFILGFAFALSILIVTIMNQFSFLEEKRKLSVLRVLGYKTKDISKVNLIKSFTAVIIAIPFACVAGFFLTKSFIASICTPLTSYIFINSALVYVLITVFIIAISLIAHYLSMSVVRKFDLVHNVQSRE